MLSRTRAVIPARLAGLVMLFGLAAGSAGAVEPGPMAKAEVEQLLARLAQSGCQFQRNGTWHSAPEARAHLEKKYRYLLNRKLLATAEDFIALGATQSSISGRPYLVRCAAAEPVPSAGWMAEQLKVVRGAKSGAAGKPE